MLKLNKGNLSKYISVILFCLSNVLFGQTIKTISDTDLKSAVVTIENYLNNKKQNTKYGTISINEWNLSYHNGYSPKCVVYQLNTYPYEIFKEKDPLIKRNKITISLSPDNKKIIVVLNLDDTYYAFYTDILVVKSYYKITKIPYGLHEGD